jgi:hypothetical protein
MIHAVRTRLLGELPVPVRHGTLGGLMSGVSGCIAGLILGLIAYPPTAWFATFELGAPAALAGWIIGLLVGFLVSARRAGP